MTDLTKLSKDELMALHAQINIELRRAMTCDLCGGPVKFWSLHVCHGESGVNLPLDSDEARQLTRMAR